MAAHLLRANSNALVIGTASRPESRRWCELMGAKLVLDHSQDVVGQIMEAGIEHIDMVLSTAGSAANTRRIANILW